MFGWVGCCCEPPALTVTIVLRGCNGVLAPGATGHAELGGTTYSATADGSGVATIAVPSNGTYSVTGTYGSRMAAGTATSVAVSGVGLQSPAAGVATHTMVAATNYHCFSWTGTSNCGLALPATLHLSDSSYGAVTLTWISGLAPFTNVWFANKTVTVPACGASGAASGNIQYVIKAISNTTGGLWTGRVGSDAFGYATFEVTAGSLVCPPAFDSDWEYPGGGVLGAGFERPYCGAPATWTVTE